MKRRIPDALLAMGLMFLTAGLARAQQVSWFAFEPLAIASRGSDEADLLVRTTGGVDRVELELARGNTVNLVPQGGGLFQAHLSHGDLVFGYTDGHQQNFVGFLDVYAGSRRALRGNMFIGVLDGIAPVSIRQVSANARATPHLVNLFLPGTTPDRLSLPAVAKAFYRLYPDVFDFLAIVSVPDQFANRFYLGVRNSVRGIGIRPFNKGRAYGSRRRLQGVIRFPIAVGYFDLAGQALAHEIGHRWINFLGAVPSLGSRIPHWPISSLAPSVMGWGEPGGQGLDFPWDPVPVGGGSYRLEPSAEPRRYNGLDLYLMGLATAEEAGEHFVFRNQGQPLCDSCVLDGPTVTVTAQDVIAKYGARKPGHATAQRDFRIAVVVVSTRAPLSDRELAYLDHFAARGESREPLRFASGFSSGTTLPFFLATGGRGTLTVRLP